MVVISIILFRCSQFSQNPIILGEFYELSSFWFYERNTVKELALFSSRTAAERIFKLRNHKVSIDLKDVYKLHTKHDDDLVCTVITDKDYNLCTVYRYIDQIMESFTKSNPKWHQYSTDQQLSCPLLESLLHEMQSPSADKIAQVQEQLEETREVLLQSIEKLLNRGENLNDLAQRSEDLSKITQDWVIKTKKLNSCCPFL